MTKVIHPILFVLLCVFHYTSFAQKYQASYTRNVDIIHTKLDLSFNWDSCFVYGEATIHARPYAYPTNTIVLDANKFDIHEVSFIEEERKHLLKYSYDGKKLAVVLDDTYTPKQEFAIQIRYTAKPNQLKVGEDIRTDHDRGLYFIKPNKDNPKKPQQLWSQGETECNSSWFPTINDPQEKMTQEISLTIDTALVTLSNGNLVSSRKNNKGLRTDVWKQLIPHSTYLTMIAVGKWAIIRDHWQDVAVNYYLEPEFAKVGEKVFQNTPDMIQFFSERTGVSFPWDKYSQVVVRDFVSGAMENTSASVFFEKMNMTEAEYNDDNREHIIAHELFHHWFGDLVTCESWANLPLNESFATYGEYLWFEHAYGREFADAWLDKTWTTYVNNSNRSGQRLLIRHDYEHRDNMFDVFSYHKGACVLHYLRNVLGNDVFFAGLKNYLKTNAYKSAEIHHLRLAMEESSGKDLSKEFHQWFSEKGHPKLSVKSSYDSVAKKATLYVAQTQSQEYPTYNLAVNIDLYNSDGNVSRTLVEISDRCNTFTFNCETKPNLLIFDAEDALPAEIEETKTLEEYIYMYDTAPLLSDKITAIKGLGKHYNHTDSINRVFSSALSMSTNPVKIAALSQIELLKEEMREPFWNIIQDLALYEPSPKVRAAALSCIKKNYSNRQIKSVIKALEKDPSPMVQKLLKE